MRILITGAGGFVGGAVARRLAAHELVLPSRDPARISAAFPGAELPPFSDDLEGLVRKTAPDIVINLLGVIREAPSATFRLVHEEFTRRLLAGAVHAGVRKFIQMSALGAAPDAPSEYHRSKFAGEELVRRAGLPYVIFRPSFIDGPGQKLREELKAVARFAPVLAAPADAWAAPVGVEDVAACFARAAEEHGIRDEIFELGGDRTVSFREIIELSLSAAGLRRPVLGLPRVFFRPLLPLFSLFPVPPMTRDQYLMMSTPNVPSGKFRGLHDLLGQREH